MLGITAGFLLRARECIIKRFFLLLLFLLFLLQLMHMCFNCLDITFLIWLQRYGLEEGTDLCVFYTHLTKLLIIIALLGIILQAEVPESWGVLFQI